MVVVVLVGVVSVRREGLLQGAHGRGSEGSVAAARLPVQEHAATLAFKFCGI